MHEQLPLIIELVLFRGFKEEAETLFCLSDELSKDFGLCYNMITLTERGLICRAAAKGDYKTVKNLTEFYDLQEDDKTYKYMTRRLEYTACDNIQTGPIYNALTNGHLEIYKFLLRKLDKGRVYYYDESSLGQLLEMWLYHIRWLECELTWLEYENISIILDDISLERTNGPASRLCDTSNITKITESLIDIYADFTEKCEELNMVIPWSDVLYSLVIKLQINPDDYVTPMWLNYGYNSGIQCTCGCGVLYHHTMEIQNCKNSLVKKIEKSHFDGYESIRLNI